MNKLFTKIARVFLGLSMAVGVGVAVGTNNKTVTGVYAETKTLNPTESIATTDGIWTYTPAKATGTTSPATTSGYTRLYPGNTFQISTSSSTVTKIDSITYSIAVNGNKSSKIPGEPSTSDGTYSLTGSWEKGDKTFVINNTQAGCKSITFTVGTGDGAGNIDIVSCVVTFTPNSSTTQVSTTTTVSAESGDTELDLSTANDSITLNANVTSNPAVTSPTVSFSANPEGVVNIGTPSGALSTTITPVSVGTATITASFVTKTVGNNEFLSSSATIDVTVVDSTAPTYEWISTSLSDLTSSDVFVIVGNNGNNYAMKNSDASSSGPKVVSVTVANEKITSNVSDDIKWNLSVDNGSYTFYPNGSATTWLYCIDNNNGLRIASGNTDYNTFNITDDYLYNIGRERYIGVYNSTDWRSYTSIGANIQNQTFSFYKRTVVTTDPFVDLSNSASTTFMLNKDGSSKSITGLSASVLNIENPTYYWSLEDVTAGCNATISGSGSTPTLTVSSISGNTANFTVKVGAKANNTGDTVYSETTVTFTVKPFGGSISWTPRSNMEYREGFGVVYSTLTFTTTMNDGTTINYGGDYSSLKMMYGPSASDLSELTGESNITSANDLNGKTCKIIDENNNASSVAGAVSNVVFTPKARLTLTSAGNVTEIATSQTIYLKASVSEGWGNTLTYSTSSDLITVSSSGVITSKTTAGSNITVTASLANGESEVFTMNVLSSKTFTIEEAFDMAEDASLSSSAYFGSNSQKYDISGYLYISGSNKYLVDNPQSPTKMMRLYSPTDNTGAASLVTGGTLTVKGGTIQKYSTSNPTCLYDFNNGSMEDYEGPQPTSFDITGGSEVLVGTDLQLSLTNIVPSGASNSVIWSVSPSGATVTQSGVFNATTHGVYRVTATSTGSNQVSSYIDISAYAYHRTELVLKNNPQTEYYQGEKVESDLVSAVVYYQCGSNTSYKTENISSSDVAPTYSYNGVQLVEGTFSTFNPNGADLSVVSAYVSIDTLDDIKEITPETPLVVEDVVVVNPKPTSISQTTAPTYTDTQTLAEGSGRWSVSYQDNSSVSNVKIGDAKTSLEIGGVSVSTSSLAKDYDGQTATFKYTDQNTTVSTQFVISVQKELSVDSFEDVPDYVLGGETSEAITANFTSLNGEPDSYSVVSSNPSKLSVSFDEEMVDYNSTTKTGCVMFQVIGGSTQGQYSVTVSVTKGTRTESKSLTLTVYAEAPQPSGVEYRKITSLDDVTEGKYIIVAHVGNDYLALPSVASNKISASAVTVTNGVISESDAGSLPLDIELDGDDGYAVGKSGTYFSFPSSGTNFSTSNSPVYYSLSVSDGVFQINSSGRGLVYRTSTYNVWGAYANSTINGTEYYGFELYKQVDLAPEKTSFDWVKEFVDEFMYMDDISISDEGSGACLGENGLYLTAKRGWNTMVTNYNAEVAVDDRDNLVDVFEASFEDAYSRYMAWAAANGDTQPFIGTTIQSAKPNILAIVGKNPNTAVIIVIVSMVSVSAIGGYFFLRRRKEQ